MNKKPNAKKFVQRHHRTILATTAFAAGFGVAFGLYRAPYDNLLHLSIEKAEAMKETGNAVLYQLPRGNFMLSYVPDNG